MREEIILWTSDTGPPHLFSHIFNVLRKLCLCPVSPPADFTASLFFGDIYNWFSVVFIFCGFFLPQTVTTRAIPST